MKDYLNQHIKRHMEFCDSLRLFGIPQVKITKDDNLHVKYIPPIESKRKQRKRKGKKK